MMTVNQIRKKIFHLMMHSTRLYGVRHMVKDHSDSERGNLLPPLPGLFFLIRSKSYFDNNHPTHRIAHTMSFVTPVKEHWLEWEIARYWSDDHEWTIWWEKVCTMKQCSDLAFKNITETGLLGTVNLNYWTFKYLGENWDQR